jgi:hypothetical protein
MRFCKSLRSKINVADEAALWRRRKVSLFEGFDEAQLANQCSWVFGRVLDAGWRFSCSFRAIGSERQKAVGRDRDKHSACRGFW